MSTIKKLTPTNLFSEKEKFFADETYNPQFMYEEEIAPKELILNGLPEKKYADLATEILDKTYFGRNEHDLFMMEGQKVPQEKVNEKIQHFLEMHHLENRVETIWSSTFVSRATMTPNTLNLRLPADFHQEGLIGMIYHELGTHALRRINYEQQPWFNKRKKYGFQGYLITEEGLAILNELVPHTLKATFKGAIRYLAVSYAQNHTFAEVWQYLKPYVQDQERRWVITLRAKRGLIDTSQPGGSTKDLVYLKGTAEVWQWLSQHNFDITPLYFGKLAFNDVEKAAQMNPNFTPILPSFFVTNKEKYAEHLMEIGSYNMLEQI